MILHGKSEMIFRFTTAGLFLVLAGCISPQPPPAKSEPPAVPSVAVVPPPAMNPAPLQVSRPRPAADASDNMAANILEWDAVARSYQAAAGETNASFTFRLTNVSPERVLIYDTSTTCDCTVAQLPSKPWTLAPGAGGEIRATLDLQGRTGAVTNYVIVFTSKGNRLLTVTGIPARP